MTWLWALFILAIGSHFVLIYCLHYSLKRFEQISPKAYFSQDYSNKNLYSTQSSLIVLLLATRSPLTRWGSLASLFVKEHATEPSPRLALGSYIVGDFLGVFLGFINVINVLNIGKASALVFFAIGQK